MPAYPLDFRMLDITDPAPAFAVPNNDRSGP
jgi:hypothetical protein